MVWIVIAKARDSVGGNVTNSQTARELWPLLLMYLQALRQSYVYDPFLKLQYS